MIINACLRKQRLQKMHCDSRRCANPICRSPGSFATTRDIKITAELCDSRPLANPVGGSPGRFAKKTRKCTNAPVSGKHFCYKSSTKPAGSPWVALDLLPGLAADTCIISSECTHVHHTIFLF